MPFIGDFFCSTEQEKEIYKKFNCLPSDVVELEFAGKNENEKFEYFVIVNGEVQNEFWEI